MVDRQTAEERREFSGAITLGKGVLASRLLGFARDALIASLLGAGGLADAFLVAFRLPNFFRRLLAEGTLSYALVPACMRLRQEDSPGRVRAFARSVLVLALLVFIAAALAGMLLAKPLTLALAPGLAARPDDLGKAALFLALCLPYLPLAAGAAVSSGLLLACRDFRAPALAPVALNVAMIAFIGLAFALYGPGRAEVPYLLCAGVVAAGAAQWIVQLPALGRAGLAIRTRGSALAGAAPPPPARGLSPSRGSQPLDPAIEERTEADGSLFPGNGEARKTHHAETPHKPGLFTDSEALSVLRRTPAAAFGAAGGQVNVLAAAFIASFLAEGGISALYFAERLLEFPLGLIAASMGLAALTDLSKIAGSGAACSGKTEPESTHPPQGKAFYAAQNHAASATEAAFPKSEDRDGPSQGHGEASLPPTGFDQAAFSACLQKALRLVLFCALPAAVGLACLARPLVSLFFRHGAFGDAALSATSLALLAYCAGLPALAVARPYLAALSALGDTKSPARTALTGLALTLTLGAASLPLQAAWGQALAVSLAAWASLALLARALRQKGVHALPAPAWLLRVFAASALTAIPVLLLAAHVSSNALCVALGVPLGVGVYFALTYLLRLPENEICLTLLRGGRKKTA